MRQHLIVFAAVLFFLASPLLHATDVQLNMTWTPPTTTVGGDPIGQLDHHVYIWLNDQSASGPTHVDYLTGSGAGVSSTVVNNLQEGDTLTVAVTAIAVASGLESAQSNVVNVSVPQTPPEQIFDFDVQLQVAP